MADSAPAAIVMDSRVSVEKKREGARESSWSLASAPLVLLSLLKFPELAKENNSCIMYDAPASGWFKHANFS